MAEAYVQSVHVYPIKSCGPAPGASFDVGPYGFAHDREFMVTRANGSMLTQRNCPPLSLVSTALFSDYLYIKAPGVGELEIPLDNSLEGNEVLDVEVFKKRGKGTDQGLPASQLFSKYLGIDKIRLLRLRQPRTIDPDYQVEGASIQTGFADGYPFTLASHVSFEALRDVAGQNMSILRFRPNIVVNGHGLEPYAEDRWRRLQIGQLSMFVVKADARCAIPDVENGILPDKEDRFVTQALQRTRSGPKNAKNKSDVYFAQNLTHTHTPGARIRIGDDVTVVEQSNEPNVQIED